MIPSYILLAVLSMFLVGIADFVYSRAVRKGVTRATMICSQGAIFFPLVTLWAILEGTYVWTPYALLGSIAGFLIFFWHLRLYEERPTGRGKHQHPYLPDQLCDYGPCGHLFSQ